MNTFGERLRGLRATKGYSQGQIAKYIQVNPGLVSQWESGKCVLRDQEKAKHLAAFLGTTYEYLMYGKPEGALAETFKENTQAIVKPKPGEDEPLVYRAEDGRKLDDLNLLIRHLRDMHISVDEKRRLHNRLSQMRTEVESVVLFGE